MIRACAILFCLGCHEWVLADSALAIEARPRADTMARACSGCHGSVEDRNSHLVPSLDGMPGSAFIRAMQDFKTGKRRSSIMNRIARGYQDADCAALADYFERL